MKDILSTSRTEMDRYSGPGTYRIEVEGELGAGWTQRVGNLRVTSWRSERGGRVTVLQGTLCDQAALAGVLNTLYELHMPLISVQRLDDGATPMDATV